MNPHAHRSFGTRKQTGAQAKRALTNLLAFCTLERLASFTAAKLAAMFNVSLQVAGEMLERARARRGNQPSTAERGNDNAQD